MCNSDTDVRKRDCPDNGPAIRSMSKPFHHSHVREFFNQLLNMCQKRFLQFIFFFTLDLLKRIFLILFLPSIVLFQECPRNFTNKVYFNNKTENQIRQIRWIDLEIYLKSLDPSFFDVTQQLWRHNTTWRNPICWRGFSQEPWASLISKESHILCSAKRTS